MRNGLSKKELVQKRIQHRHESVKFVEKKDNKMNERDKRRIFGDKTKPVPILKSPVNNSVPYRNRNNRRELLSTEIAVEENKYKLPLEYQKKIDVDYDVVFCVSSYNRYEKIERILTQIFSQESKYTFKFILLNDGSTEAEYDNLLYLFPDILYLKNDVVGGKLNYWKTINKMWSVAKKINTHAIVQLDDDFILCKNFLDILMDKFFEMKEINNNYAAFSFHLYNFSPTKPIEEFWFDEKEVFVDGGMLLDVQFLNLFNYELDKIEERVTLKTSSFTWVRLKEHLLNFKLKVYRFPYSLVLHDGNDDSKLHPNVRKHKLVYTKNFLNNE